MLRVPPFPMPRVYLGPVAWVFVVSCIMVVYILGLMLWSLAAFCYGVAVGVRWAFFKLTGRRL